MPDYDLIVVGAGTAGIPCALEGGAAGGRVLLLDKNDDIGGTLHVSSAHMSGAGSRRQKAHGIDDTPEAHFDDIMRISQGTGRADMARLAAQTCASTIDWLEDNGFDFSPETPRIVYGHEPYRTARTYYGPQGGRSVLAVLRRLLDEATAAGRVELRLGAAVAGLILEDGRCGGVRLADGTAITAGAVVLCTGGYGYDPAFFEQAEGLKLVTAAYHTSTGDGLKMAMAAGARLVGQGNYLPTFGGLPPTEGLRIPWDDRPLLVAQERPPFEIYVDRGGRRWVAEDEPSIDIKEHALEAIADMTFWMVLDARALREGGTFVKGWDAAELDRRANRQTGVHRADSLEALAAAAGIDAAGLAQTVAEYNAAVAAGEDRAFGRRCLPAPIAEAPFYALQNHGITLRTSCGIDVDIDLRVLGADGAPIDGLYAAGEILGAAAIGGRSFCSGASVTPAITFGRMLGARLGAPAAAG